MTTCAVISTDVVSWVTAAVVNPSVCISSALLSTVVCDTILTLSGT